MLICPIQQNKSMIKHFPYNAHFSLFLMNSPRAPALLWAATIKLIAVSDFAEIFRPRGPFKGQPFHHFSDSPFATGARATGARAWSRSARCQNVSEDRRALRRRWRERAWYPVGHSHAPRRMWKAACLVFARSSRCSLKQFSSSSYTHTHQSPRKSSWNGWGPLLRSHVVSDLNLDY